MKITERITRVDKDELRYEVHVDDPKTYTKPFTISLPLSSPPQYELLPYECHEGNYMLPHSLSAEREEDAAIEADRKKGIVRKRKSIQQNLDAGARPIPAAPIRTRRGRADSARQQGRRSALHVYDTARQPNPGSNSDRPATLRLPVLLGRRLCSCPPTSQHSQSPKHRRRSRPPIPTKHSCTERAT